MKKYLEKHGLTVIVNSLLPFSGFKYINIFGWIWTQITNFVMTDDDANHEMTHTCQARDFIPKFLRDHLPVWLTDFFGYLIFYILYGIEFVIKLIASIFMKSPKGIRHWVYRSISFEQEAYYNSWDPDYLKDRRRFAWAAFIFTMFKVNDIPQVRN